MHLRELAEKFLILVFTVGLAVNLNAQSLLTNGLVAYYPFSGNANDESGNGNNGTAQNTAFATDRFGRPTNAFYFNTSNASVVISPGNEIPTGSQPRTFSLWVKPDAKYPQPNFVTRTLFSYGDYTSGFQAYLNYENVSNVLTVNANTFNAAVASRWGAFVSNWKYQDWHHIVFAINESNGLAIFVDGKPCTVSVPVPNPGFNIQSTFLDIGHFHGNFFDGAIDDLRIYNRAFTSNEVEQLHSIELGPVVGLVYAVKPTFSNLWVGTNYQLQVSTNLGEGFFNYGSPFPATNTSIVYPQYFDVANWNQMFFRLQVAP